MIKHLRAAADALAGFDRSTPRDPLAIEDAREAGDLLVTIVGQLSDLVGTLRNEVDALPTHHMMISGGSDVSRAGGALDELDVKLVPAMRAVTEYRTVVQNITGVRRTPAPAVDDADDDDPPVPA
jgi:hypothetical protein